MLRITSSNNATGAARYFDEGLEKADYYAAEEASIGQWGGKAAERLGLSGAVAKEDFIALCHNTKPDGSRLNPRHSDTRKVGYDFTFSVPKSVSVAYAMTGDERIRQAFEASVEATMRDIESNMRTQTGQGKDKQHQLTGEAVWASFTHRTTRPVDGIPDPHLHRHCFVMNTTWNAEAGRFQAGEFGHIKQTAPYYEAAFQSRMAYQLRDLGYGIERRGYSWEIQGIADTTLDKFSRRTALIEEKAAAAAAAGQSLTAQQKDKLGALTRAKKLVGKSWEKLREIWKSWLTEEESDKITRAGAREFAGEKKKDLAAADALAKAEQHLFERKSVVKDYQLKAETLKRGFGEFLPEAVDQAIAGSRRFHQRDLNGTQYITTEEAVREEYKMLSHLRASLGKALPLNPDYQPKADYLNEEQKAAIHHALNDTNRVTIISGGAGTGKTTLMKEVRDGIEAKGVTFIGFAPSAAASRGVMREEGFDKADTLAQLFQNPKLQQQTRNAVIWVDEAGLIGNKDMNRLFDIAKEQNARLLLTGDTRQHSSVAAGDALRILEQEGGMKVARVTKIQRQKGNSFYKRAVYFAAEGKTDAALHQLDAIGAVVEIHDGRERLNRLVEDYVTSTTKGQSALIVSPTHIEGQDVTATLRDRLKAVGQIRGEERRFLQLKATGWTEEHKADVFHYRQAKQELALEFHQNADGHKKGERWQVVASDLPELHSVTALDAKGNPAQLRLEHASRFTVYQQQEVPLAIGDKLRITKGGTTLENTRINNGDVFSIIGFTEDGHIRLHTGKTLAKDYGHVTHGYVTTSHSSQGKTVDQVFIAQSSESLPAASQQQFYVSISRGRNGARIYTDDKLGLEKAVLQDGQRMTAREVAEKERLRRARMLAYEAEEQMIPSEKQQEYGKGRSL